MDRTCSGRFAYCGHMEEFLVFVWQENSIKLLLLCLDLISHKLYVSFLSHRYRYWFGVGKAKQSTDTEFSITGTDTRVLSMQSWKLCQDRKYLPPPPRVQTDACKNITFLSYYVRGRQKFKLF